MSIIKNRKSYLPAGVLLLLLLVTAMIYWPGLGGDLILDDMPNLGRFLPLESGEKSWQQVLAELDTGIRDRPVSMLSFFGNFFFTGSDIWYLKFTNLLIHLACGVLVYLLSRSLLSRPVSEVSKNSQKWLAVWITAMWLLAPLHVSTTLYVVQRMAQLATLFILAGLTVFCFGREKIENKDNTGYWLVAIAFLLIWPFALLSKENGLLFPLLILLIEIFFYGTTGGQREIHKKFVYGISLLIVIPVLAVSAKMLVQPDWLLRGYVNRDFTLYERVLTQPRILFDYAANLLMLPGGSGMGLFHDDFVKSSGLLSPPTTLISTLTITGILVVAFMKVNTRTGAILSGLIFYLAGHVLESTILPLELYFEHRNYLPAFGIFLSMAMIAGLVYDNTRIKKIIILAMCILVAGYAAYTSYRVDIWRSWDSILLSSELHHPNSLRVQRGLAIVYIFRAELSKAIEHLQKADQLDDEHGDAGITLKYLIAHCYAGTTPPESIYRRLQSLENFQNDHYTGTVILWFVDTVESGLCNTVDVDRIISLLDGLFNNMRFQRTYSSNPESHVFMARLLAQRQKLDQAIWHLQEARKLRPDSIYLQNLLNRYQADYDRVL